jgi:lipoic acid synthetase
MTPERSSYPVSAKCSVSEKPALQRACREPHLKKRLVFSENIFFTKRILSETGADTVCESSLCPNLNECFSGRHATFMILGTSCTRSCGFCAVAKRSPGPVDPQEPGKIAAAAERLGLKYVILTSVTRDDLDDGGAGQFAKAVSVIKRSMKDVAVEVLVPDFNGSRQSIEAVLGSGPDVFGHNIETVRRMYPAVRRGADYDRSLGLLRIAKASGPGAVTKSGIMLGLGESREEVLGAIEDIRSTGCDMLTIGQYMRPARDNVAVSKFYDPADFAGFKDIAIGLGFKSVSAGPFVRSSYFAEEDYIRLGLKRGTR